MGQGVDKKMDKNQRRKEKRKAKAMAEVKKLAVQPARVELAGVG